ncbi:MAG: PD-(D/E)XK nuclease-like domain-containing protein [Bacteroides sp.]|nr:PD-(D/E)XK nuclease-like domain-containing protein [Bacteroides sp.]MCM1555775.1 PD-(D/E)XK nuclease-like domain-containing protein [Bacteroides sp.]
MNNQDAYYSRAEVSNSDLSWLKRQLHPADRYVEPVDAYRFGRLIDYMLTEPDKVDYLYRTAGGEAYSESEWALAEDMKRAFLGVEFCRMLRDTCQGQEVMTATLPVTVAGVEFTLPVRCKYDFWSLRLGWGGDLKSTTAETQAQFEQAAEYFDYDRQRAWYMDISGAQRDVLIAVSKKNLKVFQIPITRDSALYKSGKRKYTELAWRWCALFGNKRPAELLNR